jgi:hypothetical protein
MDEWDFNADELCAAEHEEVVHRISTPPPRAARPTRLRRAVRQVLRRRSPPRRVDRQWSGPIEPRAPPRHGSLVQAVNSHLTIAGTTQTSGSQTTTAGNTVLFFATYNSASAGTVTPSDSQGNNYTRVASAPYAGTATGRNLDCWVAQNIIGGATTYTFATTGSDTPSIFAVEFAGRAKVKAVDLTATASDSSSGTGSHTTGSITPAATADDIIAFNASSTVAQVFTAGGSWTIPTNGTITASAGYDAMIQYQNAVASGSAINNTYSVTLSDKLDAFMVALQLPMQPYSDEFGDGWDEDVPPVPSVDSYQQTDRARPVVYDDAWEWTEDATDDFDTDQTLSVAVVSAQPPEDVWDWDDAPDSGAINESFQQSDQPRCPEDPWDFDAEQVDPVPSVESYQQSDVAPPITTEDPWDFDSEYTQPDYSIDSYQQTDVPGPLTPEDAWDWDLDQTQPDYSVDSYQQTDNPTFPALGPEDAWDLDGDQDVPPVASLDSYQQTDLVLLPSPVYDDAWDHEGDQDVAPVPSVESYIQADAPPIAPPQPVDDSWDWDAEQSFDDDSDTYGIEPVGANQVQPLPREDHDLFDEDTDDDLIDHFTNYDATIPILDEAWDWDFEQAVQDDFDFYDTDAVPPPPPPTLYFTIEDAWDWSEPDDYSDEPPDDDGSNAQIANVIPVPANGPEDAYNHDEENIEDDLIDLIDDGSNVNNPNAPPSTTEGKYRRRFHRRT